jgi:hypothetical protein
MSLDTEKLHRLNAKRFDLLYEDHKPKWNEMVANATTFAKTFLKDGGDKVRSADISAILQNAIKVDPQFEEHLQSRSLQQKYWVDWFSDYVVEQVYPPPDIP